MNAAIGAEMQTALADVLVDHQRMDIGHCLCGWGADAGNIGQSHACHVADLLLPIVERRIAQAHAETVEQIAVAIEALPVYNGGYEISPDYKLGHRRAQNHAARIARQHAEGCSDDA